MRNVFVLMVLALAAMVLVLPRSGAAPEAVVLTTATLEGDNVAGVGNVTRIDNVAINNSGTWAVEADTDNPDTDTDSVLLFNGFLLLREGGALLDPPGTTLDSFDSVQLNGSGEGGFNHFLDGVPTNQDSGVYFKEVLVIQESDISTSPAFTPGTPYIGFFEVKINDANQLMIVASIDDTAISSTVDRALVIAQHDGAGNLVSETVLAKEGDILPGQVEAVADFSTGPHSSAFNNLGQILYLADLAGSTSTDGALYLDMTLLAQEGSPSPLAGRAYQTLLGRGLDLAGSHWVINANLDGDTADDEVIILDGALFRQEGESFAAIAPFALTSFGTTSGPVEVDANGNVLWFGDWDDPDTDVDTGLFLNDQLLVQEGVTMINGVIVDTIASGQDAFQLSPNGQWAIFEAVLDNGLEGAFLIHISDDGENEPPVAVCADAIVQAPSDACAADASVDGGSFDPDGDPLTFEQSPAGPYPIGTTPVTLTVSDGQGGSDSCNATVTVLDVTPPEISIELDPAQLWPPNHRLVDVTATVIATDLCSTAAVSLTSITSDEPDDAPGDGDGATVNDIQLGADDFHFRLRAERAGTGDGRVYTVTYSATDDSGNTASAMATAFVPHDRGGVVEPLLLNTESSAGGTAVNLNEVQGAQWYNVIRGNLAEIQEFADRLDLGQVVCVESHSLDFTTAGSEDPDIPAPGEAFFYLVEYHDQADSGYGTVTASKPRIPAVGDCE